MACFVAASVSLPMAWISLSKVALFLSTLVYAVSTLARGDSSAQFLPPPWTTRFILFIAAAFGISLLWTSVDQAFALQTLVKHLKLLDIVLLVYLIRSAPEARRVAGVFIAAQVVVLALSWLIAAGLPLPMVSHTADSQGTQYVVFAQSYIDQSLMFCVLATVIWHTSPNTPRYKLIAGVIALAALANVFILLPGRTGYIAGIAVLSLAAIWSAPPRYLVWATLTTPVLMLATLYLASDQSHQRIQLVLTEIQHYSEHVDVTTSSGWRLNAWHRSLQAVEAQPAMGHGVGSWATAVKSIEGPDAATVFGTGNSSNPHQEFLLWGVELGVGGSLLLLGLLLCMAKDAMSFPAPARRCMYSVLMVVGIACLFNSALYDDLIGDYLCVAMGIFMAYGLRTQSVEATHRD